MPFSWDETKRAANLVKHGIDFGRVTAFAWELALVRADLRFEYGEVRLLATAPMHDEWDRLFVLVYTVERRSVRVISLRRASNREIRNYEDQVQEECGD